MKKNTTPLILVPKTWKAGFIRDTINSMEGWNEVTCINDDTPPDIEIKDVRTTQSSTQRKPRENESVVEPTKRHREQAPNKNTHIQKC